MSTVTERLARERYEHTQAARCAQEGHGTGYWHYGDYSVPDRRICSRCGAELESRPHGQGDA
jgi:hypothetical protein